jgi:glutamate N-acetyltransferase/amino-acid N-acetyltransferase
MLRPDMATMLAFLATDAPVAPPLLDRLCCERAVDQSFHRISVDGDTSTNDAVLLAATGARVAGVAVDESANAGDRRYRRRTWSRCVSNSRRGWSGTAKARASSLRLRSPVVLEQPDECLDVAFTAGALTAGEDGPVRRGSQLGTGARRDRTRRRRPIWTCRCAHSWINDIAHCPRTARAPRSMTRRTAASAMAARRAAAWRIDLNRGDCAETVWTSDFSYDYVRINAEYRS